jgi:hypothetical protein
VNEWLNANYPYLIAIAAGFAFRWAAGQFLSNATKGGGKGPGGGAGNAGPGGGGATGGKKSRWGKSRIVKFIALIFYVIAGLLFAYGALPAAQWVIGWGTGFGGWVAVVAAVLAIAAGWHALHGLVGLGHDMTDGTPDDEAFKAAFMIPTTVPLGGAALIELFTNPRGQAATGVAVVAISLITALYAHKILKKTHAAQGHYGLWMWISTIICIFVGLVHIPALIYLNQIAGDYLPEWAVWLVRAGLVISGVIFAVIGFGDLIRDWIPEKWSQWAAMYTIPTFTVLAVSLVTLQSNAATSLNTVFGAFS